MRMLKHMLAATLLLTAVWACDNRQPQSSGQQSATLLSETTINGNTLKTSGNASTADGGTRKTIVQYELPSRLKDRPEIIIQRTGYTVSYNKETRTPNWVAWHLTKSHTGGRIQRSEEVFTEDTSVPMPRATDNDYYNSRYDRGHMCPAGDNKWDAKAMEESFLFTNICPQNHGLNKYEWNDVEKLCREWARKYGAVDIVCGPLYQKDVEPRYIGKNKVRVPDAFFKVVLCRQGTPKSIAFVFRNQGKKMAVEEAVCSVDDVERMTGIDFFYNLDDGTENEVEARAELADW